MNNNRKNIIKEAIKNLKETIKVIEKDRNLHEYEKISLIYKLNTEIRELEKELREN